MDEVVHAYICSLGFKLIDDQELQTWAGEATEYIYENDTDNVQFTFDDWKNNHSVDCTIPHGGGGSISHWLDDVYQLPNVVELIRKQIAVLEKYSYLEDVAIAF